MEQRMSGYFHFLKENQATEPVLAYPGTSKPYILYTDASDDCIWACLCQKQNTQGEIKLNEPNENLFPIHHINLQLQKQTHLKL